VPTPAHDALPFERAPLAGPDNVFAAAIGAPAVRDAVLPIAALDEGSPVLKPGLVAAPDDAFVVRGMQ
jgi:hypothetical protein